MHFVLLIHSEVVEIWDTGTDGAVRNRFQYLKFPTEAINCHQKIMCCLAVAYQDEVVTQAGAPGNPSGMHRHGGET